MQHLTLKKYHLKNKVKIYKLWLLKVKCCYYFGTDGVYGSYIRIIREKLCKGVDKNCEAKPKSDEHVLGQGDKMRDWWVWLI